MIKSDFTDLQSFLLIDLSYFLYHNVFSSLKRYEEHFDIPRDQKELFKIDFSADEDFVKLLEKGIVYGINSLRKEYSAPKKDILFARDCSKYNIWRRSFFKEYKAERMVHKEEGLNFMPIFQYCHNSFIPKLCESEGYRLLYHPIAEGDDIIAICKSYIRKIDPRRRIIICAHDKDFIQLLDENTIIVNLMGKNIAYKDFDPKKSLKLKILMGDRSDGIPQCFPRCGFKTAEQCLENPEFFKEKFKKYPSAVEQYKLNRQLIDFNFIPLELRKEVEAKIND